MYIAKLETLEEAYGNAKRNGGAAGIDRQNFEDIESQGRTAFLVAIREDLVTGRYKPKPNRRVYKRRSENRPHYAARAG